MMEENASMAIVIFIILAFLFAKSRLGNGIVNFFCWVAEGFANLFMIGISLIGLLLLITLIIVLITH